MAYNILPYSFRKAKELGVVIKPSSNALKKIDVFKNGKKVASIGARGMNDYPTYLAKEKNCIKTDTKKTDTLLVVLVIMQIKFYGKYEIILSR